jgi:hypothetical protein
MRFSSSSLPTTSFPCIFPMYLNSGSPENKIIMWKIFFPFQLWWTLCFFPNEYKNPEHKFKKTCYFAKSKKNLPKHLDASLLTFMSDPTQSVCVSVYIYIYAHTYICVMHMYRPHFSKRNLIYVHIPILAEGI